MATAPKLRAVLDNINKTQGRRKRLVPVIAEVLEARKLLSDVSVGAIVGEALENHRENVTVSFNAPDPTGEWNIDWGNGVHDDVLQTEEVDPIHSWTLSQSYEEDGTYTVVGTAIYEIESVDSFTNITSGIAVTASDSCDVTIDEGALACETNETLGSYTEMADEGNLYVGSFTDSAFENDYSLSVDWGGCGAAGDASLDGRDVYVSLAGAEDGTWDCTATVTDDETSVDVPFTLIVDEAPLSCSTDVLLGPVEESDSVVDAYIGSFDDGGVYEDDFSVTVDWGDSGATGSVSLDGTVLYASFTGQEDGEFDCVATVHDDSTSVDVPFTIEVNEPYWEKPDVPATTCNAVNPDPSVAYPIPSPATVGFGAVSSSTISGPGLRPSGAIAGPHFADREAAFAILPPGEDEAIYIYPEAQPTPQSLHVMNFGNAVSIGLSGGTIYFNKSGGTYNEAYGYGDGLSYNSGTDLFTLQTPDGSQSVYYGNGTNAAYGGQIKQITDAGGNVTTYTYNGSHQLTEELHTNTTGTVTVKDSYSYTYNGDGQVSNILFRTKTFDTGLGQSDGGTAYTSVRQTAYAYYGGSDSNGNQYDLKSATTEDGTGATIDVAYYRYWKTGSSVGGVSQPAHALKYVLTNEAYARAVAGLSSSLTPLTASDSQLAPYADEYFEYDSSQRVAKEIKQGAGCSSCSGGQGTYTYAYGVNGNSPAIDFNQWMSKTTVTQPDGTVVTHYYNGYGQDMLDVTSDGTNKWGTFTEYDSSGRPILVAQPSAVALPNSLSTLEQYNDLLHKVSSNYQYLYDGAGLISTTVYYSGTTATNSTPGSTDGYVEDTYVKQGETGTAIHQEHLTYYKFTGGGSTVYPVAADTVYGDTAGSNTRTTSHSYTMYSSSTQIKLETITYPNIGTGQNGPNSADTESTYFDTYGRPIWTKDADGHVTYTAYDMSTDAIVKTITDVVYASLSGAEQTSFGNTGWSNPSGGLHLVTTYTLDHLGRMTSETSPNGNITYTVYNDTNHEVRTYTGWQSATGTATSNGSTTTLICTSLTGATDAYVGWSIRITAGTDSGQQSVITAYNSSTHTLTFSPALGAATTTSSVFVLGGTTGPISVSRDYRPAANTSYFYCTEMLTSSSGPHLDASGLPDGTETIAAGNLQSLSRDFYNAGGQVLWSDKYFDFASQTYSQTASADGSGNPADIGTLGTHYYRTVYGYDEAGRNDEVVAPTGTINRMVYDALGRVTSRWVGTTDTHTGDDWTPGTNTGNMIKIEDDVYDGTHDFISPPSTPSLSSTSGGSLGGATYYVVITYIGAAGETLASSQSSQSVSSSHLLVVTSPSSATGATGYNVYVSMSSGTQTLQNASPINIGTNWTEPTSGLVAGVPVPKDVGDGDLTQVTLHPGLSQADRVTQFLYDFRDRQVVEKDSVQVSEGSTTHRPIFYTVYDNMDEATRMYRYDGDGVAISDFASTAATAALPTADKSALRALTVASYDDQGRAYLSQVYSIDQSTGVNGMSDATMLALDNLATNTYYDHRGDVIAVYAPGGLVTKDVYDGVGRVTTQYTTDGGAVNNSNVQKTTWSDAGSVTNDLVLAQTEYTYDSDGNVILTVTRNRFDNDSTSSKGGLGDPGSGTHARVYYMADYYDAVNRLTDEVNVGTNNGSSYSRPGTVPSRSDTVLVTHTDYDAAGNAHLITDPRGTLTEFYYDMLGRTMHELDNSDNGGPAAGTSETIYTYDGDDNVLTMQAIIHGGTNQTTQYVYGVGGSSGSNLFSNDLIVTVEHPTKTGGSAGTPSSSSSDDINYSYDLLGEVKSMTDQNGSMHSYSYDVLGRMTLDAIISLGSGVDGSIRALGYSYNALNLPFKQTSYSDAAATTVVNEVEDVYNGLGQLTTQYQEHGGAVNTGSSLKVQYGYTLASDTSRLTSMTYPNGRVEDYVYNSGLDSDISRVSGISDDAGTGSGNVESYTYLGLDTIVERDDGNGVDLSYIQQGGDTLYSGDGGDRYTGLDRFGRVIDQFWFKASGPTTTDRFQYGYDRDSNVLYKNNLVSSTFSELYHANSSTSNDNASAYDNLNRLTGFRRGTLSSSGHNGSGLDTVSSLNAAANSQQSFTLDAVGNQTSVTTDGSATSRTVNSQNEVTAVGGNSLAFDNNGNTTTDDQGHTLVYDAWNRLMKVKNGGSTLTTYTFDANGRRITENPGTATDVYFSSAGQVLEERQSSTVTNQYVWGLGYVNDIILRDDNSTGGSYGKSSSGLGRRLYYQQDANYNVTALVNTSGSAQQRYIYIPYGIASVLTSAWAGSSESYGNAIRNQGERFDTVTGISHSGLRDDLVNLGIWAQKDSGYWDGMNLYRLDDSNPVRFDDPTGLCGCDTIKPDDMKADSPDLPDMQGLSDSDLVKNLGDPDPKIRTAATEEAERRRAKDSTWVNQQPTTDDPEIRNRLKQIERDAPAKKARNVCFRIGQFLQDRKQQLERQRQAMELGVDALPGVTDQKRAENMTKLVQLINELQQAIDLVTSDDAVDLITKIMRDINDILRPTF